MRSNDADDFKKLLTDVMGTYNRELSAGTQMIWWRALMPYDLQDVSRALSAHIVGKGGHFAPLPADVINAIGKKSGHMPAEEAWPLALTSTDERESIIWTTQIAEAMGAAQPCLDAGDKYGARLAFMSAYERLTDGTEPAWRISLGDSHEGRERAVDTALKRGLMRPDQVAILLPYDCRLIPTVSGLLPPPEKTAEEKKSAAKLIEQLRELLK